MIFFSIYKHLCYNVRETPVDRTLLGPNIINSAFEDVACVNDTL